MGLLATTHRRWITALALAAVVVTPVRPALASGINLAWGDCGTFGTMMQTFACDVNTGAPFALVGSFVPPAGVDEFLGIAAQVDLCTMTPTFVDWWAHGAGQCRGTGALTVGFDFTSGPFNCTDFYFGQAAGGFAYDVSFGDPDRARLRIQCAVPIDNRGPVDPSTEYYAFRVNINRSKSTGVGSCAGCTTPVCIILNSLQLFQPPEAANDPILSNPVSNNNVSWQGIVPSCPFIVSAKATTWGQVKARFR